MSFYQVRVVFRDRSLNGGIPSDWLPPIEAPSAADALTFMRFRLDQMPMAEREIIDIRAAPVELLDHCPACGRLKGTP